MMPTIDAGLRDAVLHMLEGRTATGKEPAPAPSECHHPQELALALVQASNQAWAIDLYAPSRPAHMTTQRPPRGSVVPEVSTEPCNHARALATNLRAEPAQNWWQSLDDVRNLVRTSNTAITTTAPAPGTGSGRLFDLGVELPEFRDPAKAET